MYDNLRRYGVSVAVLIAGTLTAVGTSPSAYGVPVAGNFSSLPPITAPSVSPLVMLLMSRDHQLYIKAYTDYTDLDGDGTIDTTYNDGIEYYGYFDSAKCYSYIEDSALGRFRPSGATTSGHQCDGTTWSGNFLNWATMTRMDVIRKVLYGGYRSTDSNGLTVLERSLIPIDSHAFAKVFESPDINRYTPYNVSAITLCNVTYNPPTAGQTQNVDTATNPPKVRVASGVWPQWAAAEMKECLWRDEEDRGLGVQPTAADKINPEPFDLNVRVEVCVTGLLEDNCKRYPNGNNKPKGLLQTYGEDGTLRFGLMTGSYQHNKSGGVLRRNIGNIAGNTTASGNEIDTNTGVFLNQGATDAGIVNTLNRFRLSGYDYGSNKYQNSCNTPGILSFANGECANWGNPLSEMYLEALRYLAGGANPSPTAAFNGSDASYIASLPQLSWTDPMPAEQWCAHCNIVVFSTGLNSFDTNQLGGTSPLPGDLNITSSTNAVGTQEGITGSYLVGQTGSATTTDGQCTAKTVNNLADAKGVCPEVPSLEGGYQIAGLAHYAHTHDLRSDRNNNQTVESYSVALSESLPRFTIPIGSGSVTILPNCEANSDGSATRNSTGWRVCSLLDLRVERMDRESDHGPVRAGSFLVVWEDSTWGNDYDMDGIEHIQFCVGPTACNDGSVGTNQIKVTVSAEQAFAGHALLFGYIVTGTTEDGLPRTCEDCTVLRPGGQNFSLLTSPPQNPNNAPTAVSHIYSVGNASARLLQNPLWYVAKYGGFTDIDNNNQPNQTSEWDNRHLDGSPGSDGIPDNFFQVTNPAQLETRLGQVFGNIVGRLSSGTAAAVVSNSSTGIGALYQALYLPKKKLGNEQAEWLGTVHALFIDDRSQFHEDSDGDHALDGCDTDRIVDLVFDDNARTTVVRRYNCDASGLKGQVIEQVDIDDLRPIWSARDQLAAVTDVTSQRTFSTAASSGRYIFTWIDLDTDGTVNSNEVMDFIAASFPSTDSRYRYLRAVDSNEAANIVNFVRGREISGYRSRTLDFNGDGTSEVWRLGDIVHSTPAVVGAPAAAYDDHYADSSYAAFREHYADRRQVIYVGANDGMLHAFNGGFYNDTNKSFDTTLPDGSGTQHPLGSEIWAYVPMNLLPHLRWLTQADYPHVAYVDGSPLAFDAKVFADDADHPGGWGTLLAVGMRLGGGPIGVDTDGDGTDDRTLRSAYALFDVTNPELPPTLLAEINDTALGFTTSRPAMIVNRSLVSGTNDWYLVFGSGPTDLATGSSSQNAKLYVFNLNTLQFVVGFNPLDLGQANSWVGDPTSRDWNDDFVDDAVYFGTAGVNGTNQTGRINRLRLDTRTVTTLLDPAQPFTAAPTTQVDEEGRRWVYAGTGRLLVPSDKNLTASQSFYGVKEPVDASGNPTWATVARNTLQNVTGVRVFLDGAVTGSFLPTGVDTFVKLRDTIRSKSGWYFDFPADTTNPSTRNVTRAVTVGAALAFTDYTPLLGQCDSEGTSRLNVLHYQTGTAFPSAVLGRDTAITHVINGTQSPMSVGATSLGTGGASEPIVHRGASTLPAGATLINQSSTGALTGTPITLPIPPHGRRSWLELIF